MERSYTDLLHEPAGTDPVLPWLRPAGRSAPPYASAEVVQALLVRHGLRRLAVVDVDQTLLCPVRLRRSGTGSCSDADIDFRTTAALNY